LTADEGIFFVAPFYWGGSSIGSYLLILDNDGQIIYYKYVGDQLFGFDFKPLPGGYLIKVGNVINHSINKKEAATTSIRGGTKI
jgi:hypothetical protein